MMKRGQERHSSDYEPGRKPETESDAAGARLGYAHRAHSPDPHAAYSFNPEQTRVLPADKRLRWKVTG